MLHKLYAGSRLRKSRLHDEKGNFVSWPKICTNGPCAFATALLRLGIGYRPPSPWISYTAIRFFKKFLSPQSRVLEFGSGMSTIWFATHAGEVYSVEAYRPWYEKVDRMIQKRQFKNIHYTFACTEDAYAGFVADDRKGFDLILVDGDWRSSCVSRASHMLRPGGILYLDNSDKDSAPQGGDMRLAEKLAREFAARMGGSITLITDFAPTQLFVQQGLLVQIPVGRSL